MTLVKVWHYEKIIVRLRSCYRVGEWMGQGRSVHFYIHDVFNSLFIVQTLNITTQWTILWHTLILQQLCYYLDLYFALQSYFECVNYETDCYRFNVVLCVTLRSFVKMVVCSKWILIMVILCKCFYFYYLHNYTFV